MQFDKKKILSFIVMIIIVIVIIISQKLSNINTAKNQNKIDYNEISSKEISENLVNAALTEEKIKIHITGEVNNPGIIELNVGDRIDDAITLAGGLTPNADVSKTNLAYILSDGEKIYIPSVNDEETISENNSSNKNSKININTATASELETISGVGESTAKSIIEYRTKVGKFSSIEEIMNVSGIGENKFEKMKDQITVK